MVLRELSMESRTFCMETNGASEERGEDSWEGYKDSTDHSRFTLFPPQIPARKSRSHAQRPTSIYNC